MGEAAMAGKTRCRRVRDVVWRRHSGRIDPLGVGIFKENIPCEVLGSMRFRHTIMAIENTFYPGEVPFNSICR
jgi:hypothetical protein